MQYREQRAPLPPRAGRPGAEARAVNAGCGAAIARVERQTGGRVISAKLVASGGRPRCRIVVLVPSNNRNRPPTPRTVVVPAG